MRMNQILVRFFRVRNELCTGHEPTDIERIKALTEKSGTELNMLRRCSRVHLAANMSPSATRAGLVGVGLISYADARTTEFLRRVERRLNLPGLTESFLKTPEK